MAVLASLRFDPNGAHVDTLQNRKCGFVRVLLPQAMFQFHEDTAIRARINTQNVVLYLHSVTLRAIEKYTLIDVFISPVLVG